MNIINVGRTCAQVVSGPVLAAALIWAAPMSAAQAQPVQAAPERQPTYAASAGQGQGFSLQYGYHNKYQRFGLAYETPPLWSHSFTESGRLDLSVEMGVGYWKADRGSPDSLWHVSAVPVVRWWPGNAYYLEVGVGPSLLNRSHFADKNLGSRFQFTSHIGGGFVIDDVHRFGVRYTHVSNAGIKRPNPGLDLIEVSYTYQF